MTPYDKIYSRFLRKITDFRMSELFQTTPSVADDRLLGWMESAIVKFQRSKIDLSNRDDTLSQFNNTVPDYEQEIICLLMLVEWFYPEVNDILDMKRVLSDTDFRLHAADRHLSAKQSLLSRFQEDTSYMITNYTYDKALIDGFANLG